MLNIVQLERLLFLGEPFNALSTWPFVSSSCDYFSALPNEMMVMIASHLRVRDLLRLSLVNKRFYGIVTDDSIWRIWIGRYEYTDCVPREPNCCLKQQFIQHYHDDLLSIWTTVSRYRPVERKSFFKKLYDGIRRVYAFRCVTYQRMD